MAKKEKLQLDSFDLDSELNFDFSVDNIDAQINPGAKTGKRSPVIDVFKGTIEGAKSQIKDPGFIAKTVRGSLPEQYGEVFDTTDKISSNLSSLYDDTIREVKPELARLAKKVDRLVPDESKFFKRLSQKFSKLMGNEFSDYAKVTKEQLQEQSIGSSLAEIFGAQQEIDNQKEARDKAEQRIQDGVQQRRFTTNLSVLNNISQGVTRLAAYTDRVTQAYQKKSLELQYRSFFVQSELLQTSNQYFEVFRNQNEAIAKNTALPEFVKITNAEKFKEVAKGKFFDKIQSSILDTAVGRLRDKSKKFVSDFKQGLEAGMFGLESFESMREQQKMMAEMGIDVGNKYTILGNMGGASLASSLGGKLSSKIRNKLPENSPIGKFGYKASSFLKNIPGYVEQARKSDFIQDKQYEESPEGMLARILSFGLDLFRPEGEDIRVKDSGNIKELDHPSIGFTNRALRSITDVIPGYLARIYREVSVLGGSPKETPLTLYDFKRDQFAPSTKISADISKILKAKGTSSYQKSLIDEAVQQLKGEEDLSEDDKSQLTRFMADLSRENVVHSVEGIRGSSTYASSKIQPLINTLLERRLESGEKEKNQFKLTKSLTDIKKAEPDIRSEIELFIKEGYSDLLEEQGLISRDEEGNIDINLDKYRELRDGIVTSDVNVKRNIKSFSPKDALSAIKRTKVYNWFYKPGMGDQQPHTGPMAQDVNSALGNEAAPGGTKIDLTTMNGVNMAAIQALQQEQEKQVKSDSSKAVLQLIKKDTSKVVELMSSGSGDIGLGSSLSLDKMKEILEARKGFYTSVVEPTIQGAFGAMSKLFGASVKTGQTIGKGVGDVSSYIYKLYQDKKDTVHKAFSDVFSNAAGLASKVLGFSTDLITKQIPEGIRKTISFASGIKDQIKKALTTHIDLYVKGNKVPVLRANLLKLGYYFDQQTGKPIFSIDDIKGPVVDKFGKIVLSLEDIATGIVDEYGKPVKTTFEKLAAKAMGIASSAFKRVKDFYGSIASGAIGEKVKSIFSSLGGSGTFGDKSYNVLVEIRDILKSKSTTNGSTEEVTEETTGGEAEVAKADTSTRYASKGKGLKLSSIASAAAGMKDKLASTKLGGFAKGKLGKLGGLIGSGLSFFSGGNQEQTTEMPEEHHEQEPQEQKGSVTKTIKKLSGKAKAAWNDRDASGRRDGDWRDRLEKQAEKLKNKPQQLKADLTARYRTEGGLLDMIGKKASDLLDFLKGGSSGLLGSIGDLVGGLGGKLGKLGGFAGKVLGSVKGVPGKLLGSGRAATGLLSKGVNLVRGVGTPLVSGIGKLKNVASIARIASVANTARTALTVGSLATTGLGSTVMGAASVAMSGLAVALTSPVVIGAAAIGATAYGTYKAYKYFTRDDVDMYTSIRMKQYGLTNSEKDQHHNHHILQLEEYLQDGRVGYDNGKAYLLPKKIDMVEMLNIFDIDPNDEPMVNRYTEWFEHRFKPFFLTSVTSLYSINNKSKLSDVGKLKEDDLSKYLNLSSFESGPYDVQVSPFKDIERLNTDPVIVRDQQKQALDAIKSKNEKKSTTPKDQPPKQKDKEIPVRDGTQYVLKPEREKLPNTNIAPGVKEASYGQGEDGQKGSFLKSSLGPQPKEASQAVPRTVLADGPVRDGESGMQYVKVQPDVNLSGLNPTLFQQFKAMAQEYGEITGKSILVTSGYRSREVQEALYRQNPSKAAKPGKSLHEFGLALDVNSSDLDALDKMGLMRKYGFTRPVGGEPWHTEPAGIRVNLEKAKQDGNFANRAIEASLLKGGGGLGSIPGSPLRKRDTELALKTMELRDSKTIKSDKDLANDILKPKTSDTSTVTASSSPTITNASTGKITTGYMGSTGSSGGYGSGMQTIAAQATDTRSKTANLATGSNYKAPWASSLSQSESYSKNDTLFEPESKPSGTVDKSDINNKPQPQDKKEVVGVIKEAANKVGVNPDIMTSMAAVESGLNPQAKAPTSSAKGLFQFINTTWQQQVRTDGRKYGIDQQTSPYNATANSLMGAEFLKDNLSAISSVKPNPNLTDVYMAHFLGPGGARKFLSALRTNPNDIAAKLFPDAARANRGIFLSGNRPATVQQVYNMLGERLASKARQFGINVGDTSYAGGDQQNEEGQTTGYTFGATTGSSSIVGTGSSPQTSNVYDTQSSPGSAYTMNKSTPSFSAMPSPSVVMGGGSSTGMGQGFNTNGLESGINHVGEVLDKSLGVQTEMLSTLKEILANVNPGNLQQVQEGLKQVADSSKPSAPLSKPAIDLSRKSA